MTTDAEKLAQIAALCNQFGIAFPGLVRQFREVLAEPGPAVEGVTLTREEASRARDWFSLMSEDVTPDSADRALAARLEASA